MSDIYISHIINEVNKVTKKCGPILLFGENINTGSRIGGLAKGLEVNTQGLVQNVGNCELTHCGVGFGMMIDGGKSVLFSKQLDFMLLGLDQVCNTFNFIRAFKSDATLGSFTIFTIVCDQGFQGPQSSLNNASDFASIANIPVYCLNSKADAEDTINKVFVAPGFRIICLSQKFFKEKPLDLAASWSSSDSSVHKFYSGDDATILSFNFGLRHISETIDRLSGSGLNFDLFHINFVPNLDLGEIIKSCIKTRKLVVFDDSKSVTKFSDMIISVLAEQNLDFKVWQGHRRGVTDPNYGVNDDKLEIDCDSLLSFLQGE